LYDDIIVATYGYHPTRLALRLEMFIRTKAPFREGGWWNISTLILFMYKRKLVELWT
jgi:hypothetical protein